MKKLFSKILGFYMTPQLLKFALVGGVGTSLDYAAYLSLTRLLGVWYILASVVGFLCGLTNNFFWNKYWTFKRREKGQVRDQFIKFFIVSIIGVAFGNLMLYGLVDIARLHDIAARLITTATVMFWNFAGNKIWTFKKLTDLQMATDSTDAPNGE